MTLNDVPADQPSAALVDREALLKLVEKWRERAMESDKDGDFCCAVTREHDADELEAFLSPRTDTPTGEPKP